MKKYLSIDIDFWNYRHLNELHKVMELVRDSGVHVEVVDEHHHLIDDIDASGSYDVTNIDYHADIANCCTEVSSWDINCGTWAGYLERRRHFRWYYPKGASMSSALCHYPVTHENNPFLYPDLAGWKKVTKRQIDDFPYEVFRSVERIGIAMSFEWLKAGRARSMVNVVENVLGSRMIPEPEDWVEDIWEEAEIFADSY